ncbi:type I 3-dehydroquinate dehydratase [Fibrobacterota bacterium]
MPEKVINRIKPKIVGVLTSDNTRALFHGHGPDDQFVNQVSTCDILEFRADTFSGPEIIKALTVIRDYFDKNLQVNAKGKPLLFTLRLERDSGKWRGSPVSRQPLFQEVIAKNLVDWVDIEIEEAGNFPAQLFDLIRNSSVKLMVSHHNFKKSYSFAGFSSLLKEMAEFQPDIIKFAVTVRSYNELEILLDFSKKLSKDYPLSCVISMGAFAKQSRIGSPAIGAPITYGYLGPESTIAAQIEVCELSQGLKKILNKEPFTYTSRQLIDLMDRELDV